MSTHITSCIVRSVKRLTETVTQLLLQPQTAFSYQAGQYLNIVFDDGTELPFSIANAPASKGELELHIRDTDNNAYTKTLFEGIEKKQTLRITGPFGHCVFKTLKPTLFIAGGTGFAPMKAIIEDLFSNNKVTQLHLYWGAKSLNDLYLHETALVWSETNNHFSYTPVLSQDFTHWKGRRGLVHEAVAADHQDLSNCQVFAAGPPEMILSILEDFIPMGLDKSDLHSDALDFLL